ncbi:MAG: glycosyltransferase [Chloroflexi bacterium]|nr:glycosyltransferase [Chloroflexota bacterium]
MASAGKRVLVLLENQSYPDDTRVVNISRALVAAGYHVSLISPSARGRARHEVLDGVHVYRFPPPPPGDGFFGYLWEYAYSLIAAFVLSWVVLWREGFDVIHATNPPDVFVFIGAFYRLLGKRFIYDHHDLAPEMYQVLFGEKSRRAVYNLLVFFENLSCRFADHIIVTNQSYRAVALERARVPAARVTVVRNGPDLERLRPVAPDPELRKKAKTIIGYVGVIGFHDRVDYLLRALHRLVYDLGRTDFFCVLVGVGDAWEGLKALAKELEIERYVWFTGRVSDEDLGRYLSTADICVDPDPPNPFTDRSTMVKMMEYMALGKPIVAFDLTEHRFTAQGAARYVRNTDELEFARACLELMDDPARRRAMGALGRQRIETELAWKYSVPHLLRVYATVLADRESRLAALRDKMRRFVYWVTFRGGRYIVARLLALLERYGMTAGRAKQRTLDCIRFLSQYGCRPTLPTPSCVVDNNPEFCRDLQDMGVELAVHGQVHVDFRSLARQDVGEHMRRAAASFAQHGIQFEGFRCPYLSCKDGVREAIADGLFKYSSNDAIWWDVVPEQSRRKANILFKRLDEFYRPQSAADRIATPWLEGNLLEIPISLPDDLQLVDGLKLGEQGVRLAWTEMLHAIHARGELFVILFHPESFEKCVAAFDAVLTQARHLQPAVWVTRLQDVSRWWWEKSCFAVNISSESSGNPRHPRRRLRFDCSDQATVLVRNLELSEPSHPWDGAYRTLESRTLTLENAARPFVGAAPTLPAKTVSFLRGQGYIVETGGQAAECSIYLDESAGAWSEVQLIAHIESSPAPLVRFWRWPNEAKSALCVSGDLDALSLVDYASRFLYL